MSKVEEFFQKNWKNIQKDVKGKGNIRKLETDSRRSNSWVTGIPRRENKIQRRNSSN